MSDKPTTESLSILSFLTSPITIGVISYLAGAITSLFAPWNKWFIENKKAKQAYRKEKIIQWRKMVHEVSNAQDNSDKPISYLLERHEAYYSLRPHLTHNTIMEIARTRTFISGSTIDASLAFIVDEIARLEKEWDLM